MECVYAEAAYRLLGAGVKRKVNVRDFSFSFGEWETVEVPFIEAPVLAGHRRNLIISVGAEVRQARAHANRFEPSEIALVGVINSKDRLELSAVVDAKGRDSYFEAVKDGGGTAELVELEDVLGVLKVVFEAINKFRDTTSTRIFAVGCKPHALAMAVAALSLPGVELVCRKPGAYANYDAAPIGPIHHFQLVDRFEPSSFLHKNR